jgi:hypothetical protein
MVLQTGVKHYGTHLGPMVVPMSESDPRLPSPPYPPNFYYTQEDLLFAYCKMYPSTSWNIIRPYWILGAVPGAAMNILFPLAVYASVQKFLGDSLDFPGDWQGWDKEQMQSSAMLIGYMNEWTALSPAAKNHAFTAVDGGPWTWGFFWPILASWYGISWTGPVEDEEKYAEIKMGVPPRGRVVLCDLYMDLKLMAIASDQQGISGIPSPLLNGQSSRVSKEHGARLHSRINFLSTHSKNWNRSGNQHKLRWSARGRGQLGRFAIYLSS